MQTATVRRTPSDYRLLTEQVRGAGLLEPRSRYYAAKIALTIAALGVGWAALFIVRGSWGMLGLAAFLAFTFTQVVFIGHDAGHQQIFASREANRLLGLLVGNTLTGLSYGWWISKHSAHHAFPNQLGRDPDIGPVAAVVGTEADAGRSRRAQRFRALWRVPTLVPMILLEFGMHVTSSRALAKRRDRQAIVEAALLFIHAGLYLTAVFWLLSPLKALAFIAVQQGLFGVYLRLCFAPNHKGMPIVEAGARLGFVERQVITARNVTGGRLTTFMLGGLNYQIEHHLFPALPRPNLPRVQGIVREFCASHDLPYCEDSLVGSYLKAVRFLRTGTTGPGSPAVSLVLQGQP
ncbi:MAG: fatty acid desaturase family protein [Acidimicrobiales bacterium]